ncbi:MAG: hypothetical protein U1A24_12275 [Cypionkella sp.]|uniref:hypothetical protein n=1 Tax=Cypionkella sp. TaxID=2811411 RepID=UPI002AB8309E|nr:hypothetical protein [Cypionkella sp.]MDZ4311315.1 hypothetical protein [Cypionkella sp.]
MLCLLVFSIGLLAADFYVWAFIVAPWVLQFVGASVLVACSGVLFAVSMWVLRRVWLFVLNYYKYEAHTLRPVTGKESRYDGDAD